MRGASQGVNLSWGDAVEPTLLVIGLNSRTAPAAVRERFWISETRRYEALAELGRQEGIEEVIILATGYRTEFIVWASDSSLAANSVLRYLSAKHDLKLCEWKHFYRLLDDAALLHIFTVASSLDSMVIGEPQIVTQVNRAWQQAQQVRSSARSLNAVIEKALAVSRHVRNETAIGNATFPAPCAAVELARQIVAHEAQGFRRELLAERVVPTVTALRARLDEICRQELQSFKTEAGPFSRDEDEMLSAVTSRITQGIAGSLARELKDLPEKAEQERMTAAVQRLFHLESSETALAGAKR